MELKVKCNKNIELSNFEKINKIQCDIVSANLNGDTLTGDVKISGEYYKKGVNDVKRFEDIVPFTVVFRSDAVNISDVELENEEHAIKENSGIEIKFDLLVKYDIIEKDDNDDEIKIPVEYEEVEQVISKINYDEEEEIINNLAQEVTEGHNLIIKELLDNREEYNTNINYKNNNKSVDFKKIPNKSRKISVYYFNKESDLEKISKEKKVSVQEVYNKNNDTIEKRRIIIDE